MLIFFFYEYHFLCHTLDNYICCKPPPPITRKGWEYFKLIKSIKRSEEASPQVATNNPFPGRHVPRAKTALTQDAKLESQPNVGPLSFYVHSRPTAISGRKSKGRGETIASGNTHKERKTDDNKTGR